MSKNEQQTQSAPEKGPKQLSDRSDGRRNDPDDGVRSTRADKKNSGYFVRDGKVGAYG